MARSKDIEIKNETKDMIHQLMRQFSKKTLDELSEYKKEIGSLCLAQANLNSKLSNDLVAIQNSIHAHAVGVQNVYNEMQEFKRLMELK